MRTPELIATHTNTDFDAFAAMVAARKLYPEARLCLGGAVNRNVREFQALYADAVPVVDPADVDRDSVRRPSSSTRYTPAGSATSATCAVAKACRSSRSIITPTPTNCPTIWQRMRW